MVSPKLVFDISEADCYKMAQFTQYVTIAELEEVPPDEDEGVQGPVVTRKQHLKVRTDSPRNFILPGGSVDQGRNDYIHGYRRNYVSSETVNTDTI